MHKYFSILVLTCYSLTACQKSEFLDAKPDQSLTVPATLADYEALLNNDIIMNGASSIGLTPQFGEMAADNYYVSDANYASRFKPLYQNIYRWSPGLYAADDIIYDWDYPYRAIFYANVVLDGLNKLDKASYPEADFNKAWGAALFYRAHLFYWLAQTFAPAYSPATASTDWGIPLRLTPSVSENIQRARLDQTYQKIISDLHTAKSLLPEKPIVKTSPSVVAVYGLLARIYQTMQQYDSAGIYAGRCIQLSPALLDYNSLSATSTFSLPRFNTEVLFACNGANGEENPLRPGRNQVDTVLYTSYASNDLRKTMYFKLSGGALTFTGSYDGSSNLFTGITSNEMYFIRAECAARTGDTATALKDINAVLEKRWKSGTFIRVTAATNAGALNKVLEERRKELCFRGLRWTDIRRLNNEGRNITITRKITGQTFVLPPNDNRYTFPIPPAVINFNPDMPQNPR